jgi:hypothetical protein
MNWHWVTCGASLGVVLYQLHGLLHNPGCQSLCPKFKLSLQQTTRLCQPEFRIRVPSLKAITETPPSSKNKKAPCSARPAHFSSAYRELMSSSICGLWPFLLSISSSFSRAARTSIGGLKPSLLALFHRFARVDPRHGCGK